MLFLFSFPNDKVIHSAARAPTGGLQATLAKFPYLAGTIRPIDQVTGNLAVHYSEDVTKFLVTDLFSMKRLYDFKYDYEALKAKGMPPILETTKVLSLQLLKVRRCWRYIQYRYRAFRLPLSLADLSSAFTYIIPWKMGLREVFSISIFQRMLGYGRLRI